jgi:cytochrome b6-f complex iron-sulfur subunit
MDRRRFLKTTAAGGALIRIGVAPAGCGNPVSPAPLASVMTIATTDVPLSIKQAVLFDNPQLDVSLYGTVQLLVPFYPQLAKLGGAITLQLGKEIVSTNTRGYSVPIDNTILVIHQNDGADPDNQFLALQSSCPHAACPLGYNPNSVPPLVECPCHGSRFYADPVVTDPGKTAGSVEHRPANGALERWQATTMMTPSGLTLTIDLKMTVSDCATMPPVVKSADGTTFTLTLPVAQFPELTTVGGSVCGQPSGLGNPISVVRLDANTVIAVDAKCTHLGCTVAWTPGRMDFECPCHGSTFATDGQVTMGPATEPLASYSVDDMGTTIVVTIPAT